MGDPKLDRLFPDKDKRRFVQLFNATQQSQGGANHAQTLIAAFRDSEISGDTARDRFLSMLRLTGGDGWPVPHFNDAVMYIGNPKSNKSSERGRPGDLGFRRELRDSIKFNQVSGNDDKLWPRSSNQIGHFITASHFAYFIRTRQQYHDTVNQRRALLRAQAGPVMRFLIDVGEALSHSPDQLDHEIVDAMWENVYQRGMIGHELVADEGIFGSGHLTGGASTAIEGVLAASPSDVENFFAGQLDRFAIDESKAGNSYQDLLLTWAGYRFGEHMANGKFLSREEAAVWLEWMLTEKDLRGVVTDSRFALDAQEMQRLFVQFRGTQASPQGPR